MDIAEKSGKDIAFEAISDSFGERRRILTPFSKNILYVIGISMTAFHIFILAYYPIDPWILRSIHLFFASTITFFLIPFWKNSSMSRPTVIDMLLIAISFSIVIYLHIVFDKLLYRIGVLPTKLDILFSILAIVLVLEMTRRTCGLVLPILALIFISYAFLGPYLPGIMWHKGYTFKRTMSFIFSQEGIYSVPLGVSATFIMLFIIFGTFLQATGVGKFFIDFAFSIAGGTRGGAGKVSVVTSSLFGTISGSSVANVVIDGVINIPMMKKTGFTPAQAGAIEAMTSTGGQIMPPVMGAAAFLMAEVIGVPYSKICIAAAIPAILYYMAAYFMIDFQAAKMGLKGLSRSEMPGFKKTVLENGHLIIPLIFIILALMIFQYSPIRAALWGILLALLVSWVKKTTRMGYRKILNTMYDSAVGVIEIASTCASAGIIVGILSMTGLGMKFAAMIIEYSGGNLLLALILTMIVALILGMGMPTVAAYAVMASVLGPSLVKLGVPEISAHLFIFYFGCMAPLTPPVAMAAYAAAALAKANMWKVGWLATKFAIAGFIVPYMFIYGPNLLFIGKWPDIIVAFITANLGTICLAAAVQGWLLKKMGWVERIMLFSAALLLIKPGIYTDLAGIVLLFSIVAYQIYERRKHS